MKVQQTNASFISVVVPHYNTGWAISELTKRLIVALDSFCDKYEIIYVDDASPDDAWERIKEACASDPCVKALRLTKNFGQHQAISAGLSAVSGEWVVVMDGDLQDLPEAIPELYRKAEKGHRVVFARRKNRRDSLLKRVEAKLFKCLFNQLARLSIDIHTTNFGIFHRCVIDNFNSLEERLRCFPVSVRILGYEEGYIEVAHAARKSGSSSYNYARKLSLAISVIVSHSNRPLYFVVLLGLLLAGSSLVFAIYLVFYYFLIEPFVMGWASIVVSLYFLSGVILASNGVVGIYVGKIFEEVKRRPLYVIEERLGSD